MRALYTAVCLWIALMSVQAAAQEADLPRNALTIENGLPWIVGRSAVPEAAIGLFEQPGVRWDRREQLLTNGTSVVEEVISRDGPFVTARVTRSDNPSAVVYYNLWGPLLLNAFFRGPSRIRGALTTELIADRQARGNSLSGEWRFILATFAISEGTPPDTRVSRRAITVSSVETGPRIVEVDVNGHLLGLRAVGLDIQLRDAETSEEIRTYREAYIPALAALTVTEALGNSRDITNLDADPVERTRYQVAPDLLAELLEQAL